MRIIQYSTELDNDKKTILIKEKSQNFPNIKEINSPEKVKSVLNDMFRAELKAEEHMWMFALNNKFHPIGVFEISHGTVNLSLISPREIFIRLCLCGATNFVLAHNHPSGDCFPSKEDFTVTKQMKEAGELMNIKLLDHIIIGKELYSFAAYKNLF